MCISNLLCNTFKGLCTDFSARPISSKYIQFKQLNLDDTWVISTFANTYKIPSEVDDSDPWKYIIFIYAYFLNNSESELLPFKFEARILIERDLELPGLPIIKMGILFIIQTKVVKVFSIRAVLIAILYFGKCSCLTKNYCSSVITFFMYPCCQPMVFSIIFIYFSLSSC